MRYNETVEREVRLNDVDLRNLLRNGETRDGNLKVTTSKLDIIRALGKIDTLAKLTEEERDELYDEHGTPNIGAIEVTPVPLDEDLGEG